MNIKLNIFLIIPSLFCILLAGCRDDNVFSSLDKDEEVTISLCYDLPGLDVASRTIDNTYILDQRDGIWIGIYSTTGECKYKEFHKPDKGRIAGITIKVGKYYIVGVANPALFTGHILDDPTPRPLKELLSEADTWEKFKSIVIALPEANIFDPYPTDRTPMLLSGWYYPKARVGTSEKKPDSWETPEEVEINVDGDLSGILYFRRLWSEIKFNVQPATDYDYLTDIELLGAKVINVPSYTWLFERAQDVENPERVGYANAGDALNPSFKGNTNYPDAPELTTGNFICEDFYVPGKTQSPSRSYNFTFYMTENKRTGLSSCKTYGDRELSFVNTDDPIIYRSLCKDEGGSLNNNATVVELRCRLVYQKDSDVTADQTSEATFRVHLGNLPDGSGITEAKHAQDFNSLRNSKYEYKIEIINAKQILVQSQLTDLYDYSSAATGSLNRTDGAQYDLDAHYNVFPVNFTTADINKFNFRIEAWGDGIKHVFDNETDLPTKGSSEWEYYSWIELVKNPDDKKIVPYPGKDSEKILHLGDIKSEGSYTVFINEYVYENQKWNQYVNQPQRRFWICSDLRTAFGESSYNDSKYYASQRSIETYYSNTFNGVALGIEHENECFGMNVRWTKGFNTSDNSFDKWSQVDGWDNVWEALAADLNWNSYIDNEKIQFTNAIDNVSGKREVSSIERNYPQNYSFINARSFPVNAVKLIPLTDLKAGSEGGYNSLWQFRTSYSSPQYASTSGDANVQYYEALYGCMNRNRDLNGDGTISENELKWYLPTTREMMNIILGSNSLQSPLYDFASTELQYPPESRENVIFHFTGSDGNLINMDFGYQIDYNGVNYPGWQIRCVRRLGANTTNDPISPAYVNSEIDSNTKGGVIKVNGYASTSLRNRATGVLEVHSTNSTSNRVCRYGFEVSEAGGDLDTGSGKFNSTDFKKGEDYNYLNKEEKTKRFFDQYISLVNNNGECEKLNKSTKRSGWRIPNQKELILMRIMGALNDDRYKASTYFISSSQAFYSKDGKYRFGTPEVSGYNFMVAFVGSGQYFELDPFAPGSDGNPVDAARFYVRCVRDLTPEEASMSYNDIKSYSTN